MVDNETGSLSGLFALLPQRKQLQMRLVAKIAEGKRLLALIRFLDEIQAINELQIVCASTEECGGDLDELAAASLP